MLNIFEQASRLQLRFDISGQLNTEQLWTVSMSKLIDYEAQLEEEIEKYGKKTRRSKSTISVAQKLTALRLAIVTHVIDIRQEELDAEKNAAEVKQHNQKILEIIKQKQDSALADMSVEELQKQLK